MQQRLNARDWRMSARSVCISAFSCATSALGLGHVGRGPVGDRLSGAVDELDAAELAFERHHAALGALTILVAIASQS